MSKKFAKREPLTVAIDALDGETITIRPLTAAVMSDVTRDLSRECTDHEYLAAMVAAAVVEPDGFPTWTRDYVHREMAWPVFQEVSKHVQDFVAGLKKN